MGTTSSGPQVERAIVHLRGVPLGTLWLGEGDLSFATLEPGPAFDGFGEEIRRASEPLWASGFLSHPTRRVAVEALAPSRELPFELRDEAGATLAADFVNVVASPRAGEPPVVIVHRQFANAAVASVLRPSPRAPGDDHGTNA